jgi:hypothetical protein
MASHLIILQVNTQSITPTTIDANCSFKGNTDGVSNENFVIIAANGDVITWSGNSMDSVNDTVNITGIDYEDGTHLFGTDDLTPTPADPYRVSGTVINASNTDSETYTITFDVYNGTTKRGSYAIDPRIQINAGTR